MWETGRFKLFLYKGTNTLHEFLCACEAVCVHVTYTQFVKVCFKFLKKLKKQLFRSI